MTLKEQINQDVITAMKEKNEQNLNVLRMLKAAIANAEIQKQKQLDDQEAIGLVQSQIKSRRDSIRLYEEGNRPELAEKEKQEVEILTQYLPEQLGEAEVRAVIQKAIAETGAQSAQDMGKVMAKIMPELKGKADGTMISQIVKEELAK